MRGTGESRGTGKGYAFLESMVGGFLTGCKPIGCKMPNYAIYLKAFFMPCGGRGRVATVGGALERGLR